MKIFISMIAAALAAGSGLAQGPIAPPSDIASGIISRARESDSGVKKFEQLLDWESWLKRSLINLERDSLEQGVAEAESCIRRARALDIFLPFYARLLQQRAAELARNQGNRDLVDRLSKLALEADPTKLSIIIAVWSLSRSGNGYNLGMALQDVSLALNFFYPQLVAASHLLIWLSLLAMTWAGLFGLYLLARHLPQLIHLLSERLPAMLTPSGRNLVAGSAIAGLTIVGAAISLPLMVGTMLTLSLTQFSKKERLLSAFSLVIMAAAGVGLSLGFRMVKIQEQGYLSLLDEANYSPDHRYLRTRLLEEQSARPEDLKPLFALALLQGRSNDQTRAESYYRRLLELRPDNALALNNVGNLYFRRGLLDSAQEMYSQSLSLNERLAVAHYNLGQVFFMKLKFPEGRRELERASALDPEQIAIRSGRGVGGMVLDALIPGDVLWSNIWSGWTIGEGFTRRDAWMLAGPGGWLPAAGAIILMILFLAMLMLVRRARPGKYCQTCGRPICSRCIKSSEDENFCPFCSEKIHAVQSPELRNRIIKSLSPQIRRRELIRAIIANAVLPGSAWALTGRPLLSWLWALLWATTFATWRAWMFDLYPARLAQLCGLSIWVLIVPTSLIYLSSWLGVITYPHDAGPLSRPSR